MNRQQIQIAVVIAICLCNAARAVAEDSPREKTNAKPTPLTLSARLVQQKSKSERKLEIQLAIANGYDIYSERKHDFLRPLKLEVLDAKMRPVSHKLQYPKPKPVPFLDGVFYVYHGNVKLLASYAIDARPAYVRVFYSGSYKGHT